MIGWLFQFLLFFAIIVLLYSVLKYLTGPRKKLESAQRKKQFYFWDDPYNARERFFITYKGVQFKGEKKIGATEEEFVVTSIFIHIVDSRDLFGLTREDFYQIEREVYAAYPSAEILWQNPVDDFLKYRH